MVMMVMMIMVLMIVMMVVVVMVGVMIRMMVVMMTMTVLVMTGFHCVDVRLERVNVYNVLYRVLIAEIVPKDDSSYHDHYCHRKMKGLVHGHRASESGA